MPTGAYLCCGLISDDISFMKSKKSIFKAFKALFLPMFILTLFNGFGQENTRVRLEVETDPLSYLFKGYSAHVAVTYSGFRTSVGAYAIMPPGFLKDNDAFDVYTSGFDIKTDYLFGDIGGFYTGIQVTYSKDQIGLKESAYTQDLWGLNVGIRGGYRFMFGKRENRYKGLYVTPWVALMYNPSAKTAQHGNETYKQASWVPFPTFHLGWRF